MQKIDVFKENQNKIDSLNKQADDFREQSYEIELSNKSIIKEIIEEEKLLAETRWELKLNSKALEYVGDINDPKILALKELSWDDYYAYYALDDNIDLQFEDNKIIIYAKELSDIPPLVKKYGLILGTSQIKSALQKLKKDALALEIICHQLQLTV